MKTLTEIRNDYTDDDNYTHIDIWENDEEEGRTCAIVCQDTGKVYFIDNTCRGNKEVRQAIKEVMPTKGYILKPYNYLIIKMLNYTRLW